jgi:hypothetical protein
MKFSSLLSFNLVADWKDSYINYARLRQYVYEIARLEQQLQGAGSVPSEDGTGDYHGAAAANEPLLQRSGSGKLQNVTPAMVGSSLAGVWLCLCG